MGIADDLNAGMSVTNNFQRLRMLSDQQRISPQLAQNQLGLSNNGLAASNLRMKYMPEDLNNQSEMDKAKLASMLINNQYLAQTLQAQNAYKMGMMNRWNMQGQQEKGMSPAGKYLFELQQQGFTLSPDGTVVKASNTGGMGSPPQMGAGIPQMPIPPGGAGMASPQMPVPQMAGMGAPVPQPPQNATGYPMLPGGMPPGQAGNVATALDSSAAIPPDGSLGAANALAAGLQKATSDVSTRNKAKYAINIQKTFDEIDPSVVTPYAGLQGAAQLKIDQANALAGRVSPQYEKYNNFVKVQVPILADQVRQFYGTSIQPDMYRSLQQLTNPVVWNSNPQLAMSQFNALKELMNKEMATYQGNLNAPLSPKPLPSQSQQMVSVMNANGQRGQIPAGNLQAALKAGYKKV